MQPIAIASSLLIVVFVSGCASGAGREIAKGAVRGGSHGAIDQFGRSEVGKGAAHGALGATHQVVDRNQGQRAADKAAQP